MPPSNRHLGRLIPLIRPLRPPDSARTRALLQVRRFTSTARLRDVTRNRDRPQTQFLRNGVTGRRFISTEAVTHFRYQVQLVIYWTLTAWVLLFFGWASFELLRQDWLDKLYPCPPEWGVIARMAWRAACHQDATEGLGQGEPDWIAMGNLFSKVLQQTENTWKWNWREWKQEVEPLQDMRVVRDWDKSIPGIDKSDIEEEPISVQHRFNKLTKIGYDVSHKPEYWIRAYYHSAMALAKSAEKSYDFMYDRVQRLAIPRNMIRSPDNPYPWPIPPTGRDLHNPDIEDCESQWDDPSVYYVRILTTRGFNRTQRVLAGLAYATWLDFGDDPNLSDAMSRWSLNQALQSLPQPESRFIDTKTGAIPANAPYTTPNLLAVSAEMARHYASVGNTSQALANYLSNLRARRASPAAEEYFPPKKEDYSLTNVDSWIRFFVGLVKHSPMPPPPRSGDAPFLRTASDACHEAVLMAYIGEILFASGKSRRGEGLSWMRDAVDLAQSGHNDSRLDQNSRKICTQCLESGLETWFSMVSELAKEEQSSAKSNLWSWAAPNDLPAGDWIGEQEIVRERRREFQAEELDRMLSKAISYRSSWFSI